MLLEAVDKPLTYRWPEGEIRFEPGRPVSVSLERGQRLLAKAAGKVRVFNPDWLTAWRELADRTLGITRDDPRFRPVIVALDACDMAFLANDWPGFQVAAEQVRHTVDGQADGSKRVVGK